MLRLQRKFANLSIYIAELRCRCVRACTRACWFLHACARVRIDELRVRLRVCVCARALRAKWRHWLDQRTVKTALCIDTKDLVGKTTASRMPYWDRSLKALR